MKMIVVPVAVRDADDPEQLLGLERGEHGAGLVEHEDVALAIQRLEDLHALADADGQVLDRGIGIHVEPVLVRQLDDAPAGRGSIERAEPVGDRLVAQRDGLHDVEHRVRA